MKIISTVIYSTFFCLVRKNLIENLPNPFRTDGISNINGKDIQRSVIEGLVNAIINCEFSSLPGIVIKKHMKILLSSTPVIFPLELNKPFQAELRTLLTKIS